MKKLLSYMTAFVIALSAYGGFARAGSAEVTSEVEKNDTMEEATPLSFAPTNVEDFTLTTEGQGVIKDNTDKDYYKFTLAKNGGISVQLQQTKNATIDIDLVNSKNETVQSSSLEPGEKSDVFYEGLAAGTYFVKIYADSVAAGSSDYNYSFRILGWSSDYFEKEINNDPDTATSMTLNKQYTGFTDSDSDDIYKIKTTSNGKLTVKGTFSSDVEMQYVILDSKYNVIENLALPTDGEADDSVYDIFTVGVKAGTYYLFVTHDYENDEYYNELYHAQVNFKADNNTELESNNSTTTATPIKLKTTYNGIMSWNDDVDTYKVSLPVNANITLNMSQAPSTIFKATIVDSNNKTVKTVYTKKGKSQAVSLGNVNLAKGTYYVKVQYSSGDFEQVPYKLQVQPKIFWGKVEYKPGMKGKTTAVSSAKIYKIKSGKLTYYKTVVKGTETAVYGIDKYGYNLGGGLYMKKDRTVKYATVPSSIISSYNAIK